MTEGSACRVFAGELNQSSYPINQQSPNVKGILTKSGASCKRLFIVGALTEYHESEGAIQARVADPTGTYHIRTNTANLSISEILSSAQLPTFVAVTGTIRLYLRGTNARIFVNPDVIKIVEKVVRDDWVLYTSKTTIHRLAILKRGLTNHIGDEDVMTAIRYYKITMKDIHELRDMVQLALGTVTPLHPIPTVPPADIKSVILKILASYPSKTNIPMEELHMAASKFGITKVQTDLCLQALLADGECYSPRNGFIRLL